LISSFIDLRDPKLAGQSVASGANVLVSKRDQTSDLYDQHDRVVAYDFEKADEESLLVPEC
jgi:hypothetical protein